VKQEGRKAAKRKGGSRVSVEGERVGGIGTEDRKPQADMPTF